MAEAHLLYEVADGIATITMNRPEKRNAMTSEMMVRLGDAWADVRADPSVSVALLRGPEMTASARALILPPSFH